jgi:hypothetical protein
VKTSLSPLILSPKKDIGVEMRLASFPEELLKKKIEG